MSPRFTLLSTYIHTPLENSTRYRAFGARSYVTLYYQSPTERRDLYLIFSLESAAFAAGTDSRRAFAPRRPAPALRCSRPSYAGGVRAVTVRDRLYPGLSALFSGKAQPSSPSRST